MDLVYFYTKIHFTSGTIFKNNKNHSSKWGGGFAPHPKIDPLDMKLIFTFFKNPFFFLLQCRICYEAVIFKLPQATHFRLFKNSVV